MKLEHQQLAIRIRAVMRSVRAVQSRAETLPNIKGTPRYHTESWPTPMNPATGLPTQLKGPPEYKQFVGETRVGQSQYLTSRMMVHYPV